MEKPFYESKEVWLVFMGITNYVFAQYGLPSIEPTPELYGALLLLIGVLRAFFTEAKLKFI